MDGLMHLYRNMHDKMGIASKSLFGSSHTHTHTPKYWETNLISKLLVSIQHRDQMGFCLFYAAHVCLTFGFVHLTCLRIHLISTRAKSLSLAATELNAFRLVSIQSVRHHLKANNKLESVECLLMRSMVLDFPDYESVVATRCCCYFRCRASWLPIFDL